MSKLIASIIVLVALGLSANEYVHIKDGKFFARSNDLASIVPFHEEGDIILQGSVDPEAVTNKIYAMKFQYVWDWHGTDRTVTQIEVYHTLKAAREARALAEESGRKTILNLSYDDHRSMRKTSFFEGKIIVPIFADQEL